MAILGLLGEGKEFQVMDITAAGAGTSTQAFNIDAESVLFSLYVGSVTGDLTVTAYTTGLDEQETEIVVFPTISAPTSELLLKKAAATLQKIRVVATYTGACSFNLRARGVSAGASSVKIEGATGFRVSKKSVTTTASALLPASLADRTAIHIINIDPIATLWVAETSGKASATDGAPIYANGGNLTIDLAAGSTIYGAVTAGTLDVRIIETSGS